MLKKMRTLAIAACALASLTTPAVAGAQVLEDEEGPILEGTTILATSTNIETVTTAGTLLCEELTLDLTVDLNEGGVATATGPGAAQFCRVKFGAPITVTDFNVSHLVLGEGGGSITFNYTLDIGGILDCTYSATAISLSYEIPSDEVHMTGGMAGTGSGCPPALGIKGDFTLEAENGTPLLLVS